jgi:Ca2+-transporting ATPase
MADVATKTGAVDQHAWHAADAAAVLDHFDVDPDHGLDAGEAERRRERHGPNRIEQSEEEPAWKLFLSQFTDPLVVILLFAAVLAGAVGDLKDPIVIGVVLLINAGLGFYQESRAQTSMQALQKMLTFSARVRRDGQEREVDGAELVPGDIVLLSAGSRIPADGRVVRAKGVQVDESALTGESAAVNKTVDTLDEQKIALADRTNRLHMNTTLVRGQATMVVTETGMATEMGQVAAQLRESDSGQTPLQQQLSDLGKRLAVVAGIACAAVFGLGVLRGDDIGTALLDAVALAVAAVPEGLPAVVTVTLAVGMNQMAKHNAIVKELASVETLGSTTIICTDKTGTLTLNQMTARELVTHGRVYPVSGDGYSTDGRVGEEGEDLDDVRDVLLPVVLCSDAEVDDGELEGEPTEGALLVVGMKAGLDPADIRERYPRRNAIAFDSARKYMATFHDLDGEPVALVKGAPNVVLPMCETHWGPGGPAELDDETREQLRECQDELAAKGRRVLAVASRALDELPDDEDDEEQLETLLHGLHLQALVGIVDPPREEAARSIDECVEAGIEVNMVTGDHAATASAIAAELGIEPTAVTGAQIEDMREDELVAAVEDAGVFARVSPEHKVRIVKGLRANGEIVAMTGDGVNDAAALHSAHIGVAMGRTGTEVAKEAAQVVLTDDNFATIVGAVRRGRAIYDNVVKFVRFQLSTNLGAILSILVARLIGLPVPFTPIQILWVNLIMDGPPALALGVDPPDPGIMRRGPRDPDARILSTDRLARLLLLGSTMAVGTLFALWWGIERLDDRDVAITLAFTTFVLYQTFNAFNARSEYATAFRRHSLSNPNLLYALAGVVALQVLAVHVGPLQVIFDTVPLTLSQWAMCAGLASSVLIVEEIRKAIVRAMGRGEQHAA